MLCDNCQDRYTPPENILGSTHMHYSSPCKTGRQRKVHGRQAGQVAGRQTKDTFAKSHLWRYLAWGLRILMGKREIDLNEDCSKRTGV